MKTTATEQAIKAQEEAIQERGMEARVKHFFEKWKPADDSLSNEFFTDFHMLVRYIHRDAQEPTMQLFKKALELMPHNPYIMKGK